MNKYLVVYNICEIGKRNCNWYIQCLDNLLKSNYNNFDLAVSGCLISEDTKKVLLEKYKGKIIFNFIDCRLPVNITFNHTVKTIVSKLGRYAGYIYIDSGVDIDTNTHFIKEIDKRYSTGKYEIIFCQTDTDTGYHLLGMGDRGTPYYFYDHDYIVPIGKACNLHVACFGDKMFEYYGKLMPDIFLAYCSESVLSFLSAALQSKWVIIKDMILSHIQGVDGASIGYDHEGPTCFWNNLYGGLNMLDIIKDPRAIELGLGYEECNRIMMHDANKFTPEGYAKESELKNYIKEKLFLTNEMLNYNHIPYELYYKK